MNVTVTMWLCDDFELIVIDCNFSIVVNKCWNILLFDNVNSVLSKIEIVVPLQKGDCSVVRVV